MRANNPETPPAGGHASPGGTIDPRLWALSGTIWRPAGSLLDPLHETTMITPDGQVIGPTWPAIRPESDLERVMMMTILTIRIPVHAPISDQSSRPSVALDGSISGVTGFRFRPETTSEEAFVRRLGS